MVIQVDPRGRFGYMFDVLGQPIASAGDECLQLGC
jgi:hypothetical protein